MRRHFQNVRRLSAIGLLAAFTGIVLPEALAHDTLVFQANPNLQINSMFRSTPESLVLQGMMTVRLRPQTMEVELTMADAPTYRLLEQDPYAAESAGAAKSATTNDGAEAQAHFARDQALLTQRAATLLTLSSKGMPLKLTSVTTRFTPAQEVVFHFTYPAPATGPFRLELAFAAQIPPGQCDLVTIYNQANLALATATLDAKNPSWEINLPAPAEPTTPAPPKSLEHPRLLAAIVALFALASLAGLWKLARRASSP